MLNVSSILCQSGFAQNIGYVNIQLKWEDMSKKKLYTPLFKSKKTLPLHLPKKWGILNIKNWKNK